MIWQFYLCAFFAGVFLTNAIWGLFNAIIGTILFIHSAIKAGTTRLWVTFFVGAALIAVPLSIHFSDKHKE